MRIDWRPDNRPDAAETIAYHTQAVITAMNAATTAPQVKQLFDDWWKFARDRRVCQQIVDHMVGKRKELVGDFERPRAPRPPMSDTSRRMTGEHVE